jgi:hypothetical protein
MSRPRTITCSSILVAFVLLGCATATFEQTSKVSATERDSFMVANGTNRAFSHETTTTAREAAIWSAWSDVANWGQWDGGLKSASLDGVFKLGATGKIVPLSGPPSQFTIVELVQNQSYAFETALPLANLKVKRQFLPSQQAGITRFEHQVSFSGVLGWFWAYQFGPGFRKELPPTMERLARLAETSQ